MYGTRDHLDAFPHLVANNSSTILYRWLFYALVLHRILLHQLSYSYSYFSLFKTTMNKCTYEPAWCQLAIGMLCYKNVCSIVRLSPATPLQLYQLLDMVQSLISTRVTTELTHPCRAVKVCFLWLLQQYARTWAIAFSSKFSF